MFLAAPGKRDPLCRSATSPPQGGEKPSGMVNRLIDTMGFFPLQGGIKGG